MVGALALGAHGIAFYARLPHRLPAAADWSAAAAWLSSEARPGDVVLLDPWWAERVREVLPSSLRLVAVQALADDDLLGASRVWLLAIPAAPRQTSALRRELVARAAPVGLQRTFGTIEVSRHDVRSPLVPLASLADEMASATVTFGGTPCLPDAAGAFRCGAAKVQSQIRDVEYEARRCVMAHADPAASPLTIAFPNVSIGRVLRGHTGIAGEAAFDGDAVVRVAVKIDGEEVGRIAPPGAPGWHAFRIDTANRAGETHTVTFTMTVADARKRDLCFDAYTLP